MENLGTGILSIAYGFMIFELNSMFQVNLRLSAYSEEVRYNSMKIRRNFGNSETLREVE